jgi:hypothetical protein
VLARELDQNGSILKAALESAVGVVDVAQDARPWISTTQSVA